MNKKALLVSLEAEKSSALEKSLLGNDFKVSQCLPVDDRIQEFILLLKPDLVVLYIEEPEESLLKTIRLIQDHTPIPIIIFADSCGDTLIRDAINAGASSIVVDSIEKHRIRPIIEAATARFNKCQIMKNELTDAETKLIQRRDIDRAKGILMSNKNIDEDTAYKLLRKMAMDKNQRIGELAKSLILAHQLLN